MNMNVPQFYSHNTIFAKYSGVPYLKLYLCRRIAQRAPILYRAPSYIRVIFIL